MCETFLRLKKIAKTIHLLELSQHKQIAISIACFFFFPTKIVAKYYHCVEKISLVESVEWWFNCFKVKMLVVFLYQRKNRKLPNSLNFWSSLLNFWSNFDSVYCTCAHKDVQSFKKLHLLVIIMFPLYFYS